MNILKSITRGLTTTIFRVIVVLLLCFIAGLARRSLAQQITMYDILTTITPA